MKLNAAEIRNFRSIKEARIEFSPNCRILVGINEAGKTNVLRALSLVDDSYNIEQDDIRVPSPDEDYNAASSIEFEFLLQRADHELIWKNVYVKIAQGEAAELVVSRKSTYSIWGVIQKIEKAYYTVDLIKESRIAQYHEFPASDKLITHLYKPSAAVPGDYRLPDGTRKGALLKNIRLLTEAAIQNVPAAYLIDATVDDLHDVLGDAVADYVAENVPPAVIWSHTEDNLIPSSINISSFRADPSICKPLRNAFSLAGISDVNAEFHAAEKKSNGVRNLLDRVAKNASLHIASIWPDYKNIEVDIRQNGPLLETSVKDKYNLFDLKRRSDGFKRFISFLLTLSVPSKTGELDGFIILIDDPDMGLHPSGTRYVRDELIKISEKNYVAVSTHSIFMIDRKDFSRHVIVKKSDEVTTLEDANDSNILDEEVIYNALGFTFLEILKENNVIYEGWRDKRLFSVAISAIPARSDLAGVKLYGSCHVKGVKQIQNLAPLIQLAARKCIIITDADAPAKEAKRNHEKARSFGTWKTYAELVDSEEIVTAEDFVTQECFVRTVKSLKDIHEKIDFGKFNLNGESDKLRQFSGWAAVERIIKDDVKILEEELKSRIFDNISKKDIRPVIYEAIRNVVGVFA